MSGRNVAWTTAAATGVACAVLAASAAWVLLTEPLAITTALDPHHVSTVVQALMTAVLKVAAGLHVSG